ncbi:MAG TPA: AIR synthase related protein, partial [Myxococcales bacterium]|nr:AIR synthase related protein [Myxococcales bacterium]
MSSEFDLIEAFLRPFPRGRGVRLGPGSDCAAVSVSPGMQLVATTDAVVERVHFDLERFSPEDVGWKALAVNLSDLAAAGARPRWFLCALGVPKSGRAGQVVRGISRGMAPLANRFGCAL